MHVKLPPFSGKLWARTAYEAERGDVHAMTAKLYCDTPCRC
jgi:hypothetical protein